MIAGFLKVNARLFKCINIFKGLLYLNFILNQSIIERWSLSSLGYYTYKFVQVLNFSVKSKLVNKSLKALASLSLINILGLEEVEKYK